MRWPSTSTGSSAGAAGVDEDEAQATTKVHVATIPRPAARIREARAGDVMDGDATSAPGWPDRGDTGPVGFDPQRAHKRSPIDYVIVAAAFVVVLGLVLWALFG